MEAQSQDGVAEQSEADPSYFNELIRTVWSIFENQICNDEEAVKMFKSAVASISKNDTFKKIEEEFKLGALGEYVASDEEALPFLTTIMSHLHHELDHYDESTKNVTHTMTRFWEELEVKMGRTDDIRAIIDEISMKVAEVSEQVEVDNPSFAASLTEIGDCIKKSWTDLRMDVDKCIRHVRRKRYKRKTMEKVYSRVICKGINAAKNIQQKIESVKLIHDNM